MTPTTAAGAAGARTQVRLLFVDEGQFHNVDLSLPSEILERYDRLIDALREDDTVLREMYVDVARLCAVWRLDTQG
jgi:hypothetical protein